MNMRKAYVHQIIDGMDVKSLEQFAFDTIMDELVDYSDDELVTEITEAYGEEWFADNDFTI